jgi:hypothetical protein
MGSGSWSHRTRQRRGEILGALALGAILLLAFLWAPFHRPGPMIPGHEDLSCTECHRSAAGTARQQLQAQVRFFMGRRKSPVLFGHAPVTNAQCLSCHDRPDDRHPVTRFLEPRFKKAREEIAPQRCASCHMEHQGRRVTIPSGFCKTCHAGISLEKDPIFPTHLALASTADWNSCHRCHDFHGNHPAFAPPTAQDKRVARQDILSYFERGPDPYGEARAVPALKADDPRRSGGRPTKERPVEKP